MTLDDIPGGAKIFVDVNVLVYYFTLHPQFAASCVRLVDRVARGDVSACVSAQRRARARSPPDDD